MVANLVARVGSLRERAQRGLDEGRDGVTLCREIADGWEEIVRGAAPPVPPRVAVLATGGFGRRELAPYSDLDVLVLCEETPGAEVAPFAEGLLYPLWDAKVDAGHAVRSLDDALGLIRDDLPTATALLDARLLLGDEALARRFIAGWRDRVAGAGAPEFLARLRAEQDARHSRFGDTIFLLEPDMKSGPGGYRDLCVARWVARARWGAGAWSDLARMGEISERRARALAAATEWFLRVRVAAHLAAGRRQEHLRFAIQESVAPRFAEAPAQARHGLPAVKAAVAPAVEALMQAYQVHAKTVRRETERLLRRATERPDEPGPTPVQVPGTTTPGTATTDARLVVRGGALEFADSATPRREPVEMLRLFAASIATGLKVAPRTRDLIADELPAAQATLRADPAAGRALLDVLTDARDAAVPSRLEEMQDVGLLAAVLPAWEPVTGRVQHDIYHVYTVDQHTLYALARLREIERGERREDHPEVTDAFAEVADRPSLFVGVLLHDVGKPLGGVDHPERGAELVPELARRLGLDAAAAARVEFLVREHLVMAFLSQRRDLDDLALIADFARRCGTEENLRQLYVLTFCDLSAVSPQNLTSWKATLLAELYERALAYLRRGPDLIGAERAELVRLRKKRAARLLGASLDDPDLAAIFAGLPDRYFVDTRARRIAAHVSLMRARVDRPCLLDVRPRRRLGFSEVTLVADDVPGLLAEVTGVFLAHRLSVVDAAIYGRRPAEGTGRGEALDLFRVRDAYGRAVADEARWLAVRTDLEAVLTGRRTVEQILAARPSAPAFAVRHTPDVATEVRIDDDASRQFTIVEVITRDRPGLLYAITRTLFREGLDIHRSRVATEPARVYDVFYVRDRDTGERITDARRRAELREALLASLPPP